MALVSKTFSQIITFTRASTATYFDATGTLQSAAIDAPRLDYNPSTLAAQGFLVEEARTNSIRNNTMVGAVAGTPGTLPTNWNTSAGGSGITRTLVGTGTENGITYIDFQFSGTGSGSAFQVINTETTTGIAAATGQTWSGSFYLKLAAGSTTGTNITMQLLELASGSGVVQNLSAALSPTTQNLASQRNAYSATLSGGGTVTNLQQGLRLLFTNGVAVDITLRIGLPQLEQGAFATSVIPTVNAFPLGVIRSADVASVNTLSPWFNAAAGTLYAEYSILSALTTSGNASIARLLGSGGTGVNDIALFVNQPSGKNISHNIWTSSTNVGRLDAATAFAANTAIKTAVAFTANDRAVTSSGTAATTSATAFAMPTVTSLFLGSDGNVAQLANGYLRRITYYPRRLSNAELQAITA